MFGDESDDMLKIWDNSIFSVNQGFTGIYAP